MKHRDPVLMAFNHEELDRCPVQISSIFEFASMGSLTDTTPILGILRKR
jgi:hypothetical protein